MKLRDQAYCAYPRMHKVCEEFNRGVYPETIEVNSSNISYREWVSIGKDPETNLLTQYLVLRTNDFDETLQDVIKRNKDQIKFLPEEHCWYACDITTTFRKVA